MKTESKSIYFTDNIGGHVALDFLNTVKISNGQLLDNLQTDRDVIAWLQGFAAHFNINQGNVDVPDLINTARRLRESIRELIAAKKEEKPLNIQLLNEYLEKGVGYLQLENIGAGKYALKRVRKEQSAKHLLAPIAEAAAELLTMDDFSLIRKCESSECVLWFYDHTKGHKRRWCSMAVCGNRHKVSKFRSRQGTA